MSKVLRSMMVCALGLTVVACKGVKEEAPQELGDLGLYLFSNFDGSDDDLLLAMPDLEELILSYDLEGNVNDRAFTMPILEFDDMGDIDHPDTDPSLQIPTAVVTRSRHPIQDHIDTLRDTNRVCLASDSTKYHERTYTTDVECFISGTCGRADSSNEIRKESLLAKLWMDEYADIRRLTLDDGRVAMVSRGWAADVFYNDSGGKSWDQNYALDAFIEDGDTTLRMYVLWSSVSIGVGDDMWAGLVKGGIDEYYDNADDFIDGDLCGNDRDREYDR